MSVGREKLSDGGRASRRNARTSPSGKEPRVSKQEIIDAAARVFMKRGFEAATVRDIARAANVSQGTLYYHIGSKTNALLELHNSFVDVMIRRLSEVESAPLPPQRKVREFIGVMLEAVESNGDRMALWLRERRSLPPKGRAQLRAKADRIDDILRSILEEGRQNGCWRDVPLTSARMAIFGMVSWATEWLDTSGPKSASELADDFADLVLTGLLQQGWDRRDS